MCQNGIFYERADENALNSSCVFDIFLNFQIVSGRVHLLWFKYLSVILDPLCLFAMDCALYASLYDLVDNKCSMSCVCENAFMSVNPHDCDATLHESFNVVDIPNEKLLKKNAKKFLKNFSKFICEKMI